MNISVYLISEDSESIAVLNAMSAEFKFILYTENNYFSGNVDTRSDLVIADSDSVNYDSVIAGMSNTEGHRLVILAGKSYHKLFEDAERFKPSGIIFKPVEFKYAYPVILTSGLKCSEINRIKTSHRKLEALSEKASEAKTQFMATISHEIRTPMNAIIGMTDLALLTNDSEEILDYLIDLKTAAGKLLDITDKMLDVSKIESGELKIEPDVFSLKLAVSGAINRIRQQAEEKGLELSCSISGEAGDYYYGDAFRIEQILGHLLNNAVKFTDKGYVRLDVLVSGQSCLSGVEASLLQFIVSDNGIGIPPEKQNLIFEHFNQVENSRTRSRGGTGLGLSISKKLAELMNGTIDIESTPGTGSRFYINIPLRKTGIFENTDFKRPDLVMRADRVLRILVVEDNPVNARLAEVIIRKLGHISDVAVNGMIALEILRNAHYDVIFMDVEMPVMDGIETTKQIRSGSAGKVNESIPIVAVTAYALAEYEKECLDAGMNYFLTKPINVMFIPELLNSIV